MNTELFKIKELENTPVLIVGLGETGLASALWCLRQGAKVTVVDTREQPPGLETLKATPSTIDFFLGHDAFERLDMSRFQQLVLSPGLSPNKKEVSQLLTQAKEQGVSVVGEIELFAQALTCFKEAHQYDSKVLAVTGTNGKTTVTSMVRDMVHEAGLSVRAAGNISPSALTALMQCLDQGELPQVWVLELSSFQMGTTQSLQPVASVVLNVTQDHLDWHVDMQDYADHKAKLLHLSQIKVINHDDPMVRAMVKQEDALDVRAFGDQVPHWVGDLGLEEVNGMTWLCACEIDEFELPKTASSRKKKNEPEPTRAKGLIKRLMPAEALQVKGRHNMMNALAALALCRALDLNWTPLLNALRHYQAQPHRMNFVRTIAQVDFINDSKGTNVGSTLAGLAGLGRKVVLILGGLGKGQDFTPLNPVLAQNARAVMLIGQDAQIIEAQIASSGVPLTHCSSLKEAVEKAMQQAHEGDVVLLSPACASMDMFKNYAARGNAFVDEVNELALEFGEVV